MSNAMWFIENLGRNPAMGGQSDSAYVAAVAALEVGDAQRRALVDRDARALGALLGGRKRMLCLIATPDDGDQLVDFKESGRDVSS